MSKHLQELFLSPVPTKMTPNTSSFIYSNVLQSEVYPIKSAVQLFVVIILVAIQTFLVNFDFSLKLEIFLIRSVMDSSLVIVGMGRRNNTLIDPLNDID